MRVFHRFASKLAVSKALSAHSKKKEGSKTTEYVSASKPLSQKTEKPLKPSAAFHNCDMLTLYFHIFPESELCIYLPCFDFLFAALKLSGQTDCLVFRVIIVSACEGNEEPLLCQAKQQVTSEHTSWTPGVWVSVCDAVFFYSTEPSGLGPLAGDQAPHLVYLTSWVGHSVSASVSLSNTPSEVSLVTKPKGPQLIHRGRGQRKLQTATFIQFCSFKGV